MSKVLCDRFQELLDDLIANPEDPEMFKLDEVERVLVSNHARFCIDCEHAVEDTLEAVEDVGRLEDADGQIQEFLYDDDDEECAGSAEGEGPVPDTERDPQFLINVPDKPSTDGSKN